MVYAREIIKAALNMLGKALILFHNHPSGDPSPSVEDKLITLMIMASTHLWDVQALNHSSWAWIRMRIDHLQMKK